MSIDVDSARFYRDPIGGSELVLEGESMVSATGNRYRVEGVVPILLDPTTLHAIEAATADDYDRIASGVYDIAMDWQFKAFLTDEDECRERMIDLMGIAPDERVLDVGAGTGRDSFRLAQRLGSTGTLFVQDISPGMMHECVRRLDKARTELGFSCRVEHSVSSATALPFPDGFFDRVFHFGGFNQFGDLRLGAAEMMRVTKVGGRVLIGDEAVAPWLKGTEFDRVVCANNPLFRADIPLHVLPDNAVDVSVHWVLANCFYVISFMKAEAPPQLDLDLPHQGWRGGTMRSRSYGILEGVAPETKARAVEAARAAGLSMHDWLDAVVGSAAQNATAG